MKPQIYESVMNSQNDQRRLYEQVQTHKDHPFLKRYVDRGIKEGFFSDMAGALGKMHNTLVAYAWPNLISRSIIKLKPTTEALERFPLNEGAIAYLYAEGAVTRLSGKKVRTIDIPTNVLADSSEEWTREFVEDATWNVLDNAVENLGKAIGVEETEKVLALYAGIADADLATGNVLAGGNAVFGWTQLLRLWYALQSENWEANVLALNPMQVAQLLNDENFRNGQFLPSVATDVQAGVVSGILNMNVVSSTLVPNGTAYAIDKTVASIMLLRRDVSVEDWEDVKSGKYGVRGTTRFGLGVLRANAVAKMTSIKQTIT